MLLAFDQVNKGYYDRAILRDVTFRVDAGARLGLIGPNGSGKTTLLRLAAGAEQPDSGRVTRAAGLVTGYMAQEMDRALDTEQNSLFNPELRAMERHLRELEQALATHTEDNAPEHQRLLDAYAAATARFEAAGGYDFERKMKQTLDGLGLSADICERPLSSLSGGEQMRVRLARLLLQEPDLLLLDEPTNHLDMGALEWLEQYLTRFRGAVLLVSHDRVFLDRTVTGIVELGGGPMREGAGNYSQYMERKKRDEQARRREVEQLQRELARQQEVVQTLFSHRKISSYHAREKVVRKLSDTLAGKKAALPARHGPVMRIRFLPDQGVADASRVLVRAGMLTMAFGAAALFTDASFVMRADDRLALVGPNGCGKTTLLKILLGDTAAQSGEIWLSATARMGYMSQFTTFADEDEAVGQTVADATGEGVFAVRSLLARFGFTDSDLHKPIRVLSGGERARLYLCLMLESRPDVLLLDEPTNHLDIESREILEDALVDFPGALLAVSHDRYFISRVCHEVLGFHDGRLGRYDSYESYRRLAVARPAGQAPAASPARVTAPPGRQDRAEREPRPTRAPARNRAQERKWNAARKEHVQKLEAEIARLEAERDGMERAFGPGTAPETYGAYAGLVHRLESAYHAYFEWAEES